MFARVWQACQGAKADSVLVACDHEHTLTEAKRLGIDAMMTRTEHASGTDRLAEVAAYQGWDAEQIVVNVQGDEPLIPAAAIDQVARLLAANPQAALATLYEPVHSHEQWRDPNAVKLVADELGRVLYFSRAPIPWLRDQPEQAWQQAKRHIGLYAYRVSALQAFSQLPMATLEQHECLEQLRFLAAGYQVVADQACCDIPAGVDTPADLARVQAIFTSQGV